MRRPYNVESSGITSEQNTCNLLFRKYRACTRSISELKGVFLYSYELKIVSYSIVSHIELTFYVYLNVL